MRQQEPSKRMQRRSALAMAPALASALAVACGPAGSGQQATSGPAGQLEAADPSKAVKGGAFTEGVIGDAATLQPLLIQDTASRAFENNHYNAPLLRRDPETLAYDTKYGTAESFQISPDGLSITYRLKNNIQWSDGRPMTAADYKFTWDKMNDPQVEYPYRNNLRYFESLTAPDERTLMFRLKEPFCPAVDYSVLNPIPRHVFENLNINDNQANTRPTVGSGPWLLQEWVKDDHATFVANDKFYLGRPNIDRYVIRIVKDGVVAYSMLKTGEVDQASIQAIDWDEAKTLKNINTINYYPVSASWVYIGYNTRNEVLKDVRVRQALAHAMDRQKIVERIRLGHAKPLSSIYASASWAYSDDVPKYNFDVPKAKQLLDAAGWRAPASDPNGTRVKDGKPLKMRIFFNAGNKEREQVATVAQQYAKAIGVELEVIAEEWNAYLNRVNRTRDMEMYILGWSSGLEPHGSQNIWTTDGAQNATGFSDPEVDKLFPQAAAVPGCSQADRKKIYAEIQKLVAAGSPYIFLWENESLSGLSSRIVPNKLSRTGYAYRPWEWYSQTGK